MSTYTFKYHDEFELEGLSPEQLTRLEHIDRLLADRSVDHDPDYLRSLSDAELRDLVSMLPKPRIAAPADDPVLAPVTYAPAHRKAPKPVRWVNPYPVVKYRAQMWTNGRNVNLGSFYTEQVRDEAVTMAKAMRDLGIPLETIREAVQRMTRTK